MDVPLRKVTARVDFRTGNAFARPHSRSRPGSPTKLSPASSLSPPPFHPKVKTTGNASLRKLTSSTSLNPSRSSNVSAPSHSRPSSPQRPSRMLPNGEPGNSPRARMTARPTSRAGMSPVPTNSGSETRQRALTATTAKLKLSPNSEERPRSGSVILHHALSISDLNTSSSTTHSRSSPLADPPVVDLVRTHTPPILAPIKIKSKVSDLIKSTSTNTGDPASRPLSPSYATTRPIHTRTRAPSITSSLSLNDPPPSAFYPITTASPAANPHRYAPRRAPSPARSYTPPTLSSQPNSAKKLSLFAKVDPASIPLPPHSPPMSALSLSSKSSVSKTSVEQTTDNRIASVISHIKGRSIDRMSQPGPFLPQADVGARTKRDRSRSKERSPRDLGGESDAESEGPERQLKAEAKTNRKIADLEITNRSLLAINASLETTRNRQAKEIRDLRRKLRESRLILPPRTYKAVASTLDDEDEEDEDSEVEEREGEDEVFQRVRNLIDSLIDSGKKALETRPEDIRATLATKVLNADELRSWRDSGEGTLTRANYMDKHDADDVTIRNHPSPIVVAVPDSGGTSSVESDDSDEELNPDSPRSSAPPPITITHSL